jgi:hypothetical protein
MGQNGHIRGRAVLYISLVVSAVLLLITNLIVKSAERPVPFVLMNAALFFLAALGLCLIVIPPVLLQAALICAVVSIWGWRRWRRSVFLLLSAAATVFAYGFFGVVAFQETKQLQQEFPYVSMEDRLPLPSVSRPVASLSYAANDRLDSVEHHLDKQTKENEFKFYDLRILHEDAVEVFVNQPTFGVARMPRFWRLLILKMQRRLEPPIPQPGSPSPSPWLLDSLQTGPIGSSTAANLLSLHQENMVDFVNADNFGFLKDRRHVAGFQEHQISAPPAAPEHWTLQTLDLIGIALHEKPVVYISEYLPRMDQLRTAPTRPLDDFEAAGLAELERGEELFVRDRGEERRMVGALRAARQCVACHGCERGDLLGAFSYRLTRDGK